MFLRLLRWLGVKVVVWEHSHNVRNATASIAGIMRRARRNGKMRASDFNNIFLQLRRIENSIDYVRKLNKGA